MADGLKSRWRRFRTIATIGCALLFLSPSPLHGQSSPQNLQNVSSTGQSTIVDSADHRESPLDPATPDKSADQQPTAITASGNPNSITNGPHDWVHRWLRKVDQARSEQPHYAAPLITTHPLLVQQFRFDTYYQSARNGVATDVYGSGKGLEIIPNTRMEVQVGIPPYYFRHAPNIPDGFGDVSIFLKFRVASAPEGKGGYFVGFFLGGSFPSAQSPNGLGHTVWSPMLAAAKRWKFFDWQTNLGRARARVGKRVALQGNLDPITLFAPEDVLKARVEEVLLAAGGRPGHIFNLGHGIVPHTPPENVARLVELVREGGA